MISLPQKQHSVELNFDNDASPFIQFLKNELQQIYILELRTNQLIEQLLHNVIYQPLKNAMLNYSNVSKDHLVCLRKFGLSSAKVSDVNKRTSELLMMPLTEQLVKSTEVEKLGNISMITGIKRILFYQMAVYRSLYTAAKKLYNFQWAKSFDDIITDKKVYDSILSEIALSGVYQTALES